MTTPVNLDFQLLGADGRAQQHFHYNHNNTTLLAPSELNSNYNFTFSLTLDAHIHVAGMSMYGAAFGAAEYGHLYWWTDPDHFTDFLMLHQGGPQQKMTVFSDEHPLIIPAGRTFCLRWWLSSPQSQYRQPFGDLYFTMHTPPA